MNKKVSIVIPTYKRSQFLERTIESVLNQSYKDIEIIVVDDNNPDTQYRNETNRLMKKYANNGTVKYIKHEKNRNGSAARNTGISHASGRYVMFLDDDDYILEDKIQNHVKFHENNDNYKVSYSAYIRQINSKVYDTSKDRAEGDITLDILKNNLHLQAGSNLFVDLELVKSIGGFDESFKRRQDIEFLTRLSVVTKVKYIDYVGVVINLDDRSNTIDPKSNEENIKFYLNKMKDIIDNYSDDEKREILIGQYLILWRSYLLEKKFKEASFIRKKYNIKLIYIIKYINYNIYRRITKKSYGFKV